MIDNVKESFVVAMETTHRLWIHHVASGIISEVDIRNPIALSAKQHEAAGMHIILAF